MNRMLGKTEPDFFGALLGTGYMRFESPSGIDGLAKENGKRLDILAVVARNEGSGQFREFISQAKVQFETICIWEDWNPIVGKILGKYGFYQTQEKQRDGGKLDGWRWDK